VAEPRLSTSSHLVSVRTTQSPSLKKMRDTSELPSDCAEGTAIGDADRALETVFVDSQVPRNYEEPCCTGKSLVESFGHGPSQF
jgi:hypothetical protein